MADVSRLAIFYGEESVSLLEVFEAAGSWCRVIWVVGWLPGDAPHMRALSRLGEVVDVASLDGSEAIELVVAARPDGVFVFDDRPLRLAAAVAERLALRFHSPYTARLLTDKLAQRTAFAQAGVPGPKFWPVTAGVLSPAMVSLAQGLDYPVVLKPQSGMGSRDTYLIGDGETLLRALGETQAEGEDMLIEEVLPEAHPREEQRFGDVLMVDSLVSDGYITHFVVAGHFIPAPPFRGTGSFIPMQLSEAESRAILTATDAALRSLGVENGFVNTDLILTPDGPRVLEVNGRIGGQIAKLLTLVGAHPLLSEAMKFAVRASAGNVIPLEGGRVAFCAMYQSPIEAHKLVELRGLDVVALLPGVTQVSPNLEVGDSIDWRRGTMSRLCTVYGVAEDIDHLYELYQQIQRSIVARYETNLTGRP